MMPVDLVVAYKGVCEMWVGVTGGCALNAERETAYAAFVVFQHEESYRRCIEDYSSSGGWLGRLLQPPPLRLKGATLNVQPAMEPSTILWEHLDTTDWLRDCRRAVTFLLSILLLGVSFATLYYAQQSRLVCVSVNMTQDVSYLSSCAGRVITGFC